jgi:5'(3')-deoxyribonucleotidase
MSKPIIAVDIDDVIADTTDAIRLWGNAKSGIEMTKEHYSIPGEYWGYYERVWEQKGLNGVLIYDDAESSLIADELEVPLLAGASFAIKELQKQYSVVLITSRTPLMEPVTRRWIDEHFAGLDIQLYFAKNPKNAVGPAKTKGQLCKELGAFLLIDDNVDHCQSVLDERLEAVLFGDYGWQTGLPKGAVRCNDWPAVLEYMNGR